MRVALAELTERLGEFVHRKGTATLLVGRSLAELQPILLPPAPESEWPDLITFQTPQVFTSLRDEGAVDFLPYSESAGGIETLAAAMAREDRDKLVAAFAKVGVELLHIVPVTFAMVRGASVAHPSRSDPVWIVEARDGIAEVALCSGKTPEEHVLLSRCIRYQLPHSEPPDGVSSAEVLVAQIEQTVASAAQRDLPTTSAIILSGDAANWETDLSRDTIANLPVLRQAVGSPPLTLLGANIIQTKQHAPLVDLAHPRMPPKPVDRRAQLRQGVLAAVAVGLACTAFVWWQLNQRDAKTLGLRQELQSLRKKVKDYQKFEDRLAQISRWSDANVHWLAEVSQLMEKLPPASELKLTDLSLGASQQGGVGILFTGLVDDPQSLGKYQERIRSDTHRPLVRHRTELDQPDGSYRWGFEETLLIDATPMTTLQTGNAEATRPSETEQLTRDDTEGELIGSEVSHAESATTPEPGQPTPKGRTEHDAGPRQEEAS